jgi:hypothetical protein
MQKGRITSLLSFQARMLRARLLLLLVGIPSSVPRHLGGYRPKRHAASATRSAKEHGSAQEGAWVSLASDNNAPVFQQLREAHAERRELATAGGNFRPGYYITLEDVQSFSSYFVGVGLSAPAPMVKAVTQMRYPVPYVNTGVKDWCEESDRVLGALAHTKAIADKGQYHECVLSQDLLPIPSGMADLGRLPGDRISLYYDWEWLNSSCTILQTYQRPAVRNRESMPAQTSFVLYTRNALIFDTGSVHSVAGAFSEHFQGARGCYHWSEMTGNQCNPTDELKYNLEEREYKRLEKVFVITQVYGDRVFHFMTECLPRLAMVYQELLDDPSIQIHIQTKRFSFATQVGALSTVAEPLRHAS